MVLALRMVVNSHVAIYQLTIIPGAHVSLDLEAGLLNFSLYRVKAFLRIIRCLTLIPEFKQHGRL